MLQNFDSEIHHQICKVYGYQEPALLFIVKHWRSSDMQFNTKGAGCWMPVFFYFTIMLRHTASHLKSNHLIWMGVYRLSYPYSPDLAQSDFYICTWKGSSLAIVWIFGDLKESMQNWLTSLATPLRRVKESEGLANIAGSTFKWGGSKSPCRTG